MDARTELLHDRILFSLNMDTAQVEPIAHEAACGCMGCDGTGAHEFATGQGFVFCDVAPPIKASGPESVTLPNDTAEDAIAADPSTTGSLNVGSSVMSTLSPVGDRDWFSITLEGGTTYEFDLEGTGATPVNDTYMRLYDSTGTTILAEDDDGGAGFFSKILYFAPTTDTYFIEAASYNDGLEGDYTVSAAEYEVTGNLPVPSVQGTAGLLGANQSEIEYYFADTGILSKYGSYLAAGSQPSWTGETDWTTTEKSIVRMALDHIESIIDVTFVETMTQGDAELDFIKNDDSGSLGTAGYVTFGGGYRESSVRMNHMISSRWIDGKDQGGQGYETLVHEIGHALGLGHTHDTALGSVVLAGMDGSSAFSGGLLGFNDPVNSIMAYRDGWAAEGTSEVPYGNRGNFGAWDQQALINLYGAATPSNGGHDTYTLPTMAALGTFFDTINDTGGTDEITAGGAALDAVIDLRPATLDLIVETAGGPVSHFKDGLGGVIPGGFTVSALSDIENGTGGTGDDEIIGNGLANVLNGGDGADTLSGGALNDTLIGGAGADSMDGGTGTDTASYAGSDARVEVDLSADTATGGHATGDSLDNIEGLIGSTHNDRLVGNGLANDIDGGLDADNITGLGGADMLIGGGGGDLISGGNGDDTIEGGADDDNLFGNGGLDTIEGGNGLDTIFGGAGQDSLRGGGNNDEISGQGDDDTLRGDGGNDTLRGGSGNDSLFGGADDDTLYGQGNNDTLDGQGGNDLLIGAAGSDDLLGGAGDDVLNGSEGGDRLDGGTGNDTMNGGGEDGARDTYVFGVGYDLDRINAFDQLGTDRIELDDALWLAAEGVLTAQEVVDTFGTLNGNSTILTLDFGGGDILEVQNAGGIVDSTLGADILIV